MIKFIAQSGQPALVGKNLSISYDQLLSRIHHFSSVLNKTHSQRIVIFSENRPEWIYALYAAWKQGAAIVPIDVLSSREDLAYILHDCSPHVVFCSREKSEFIRLALKDADKEPEVLVFENIQQPDVVAIAEEFVIEDELSTALILYTSGTTGNPKGVMLSFKNLLANLNAVCRDVPIYMEGDRVMILLPFHHILPLVGTIVAPLYSGGTMVLNTSLVAEDLMATLKQYKVSIMIGVPRLYQLIYKGLREKINGSMVARMLVKLAEKVDSLSFSRKIFGSVQKKFGGHLKYLVCGGAPIDPDVVRLFKTLGFEILEGFGMTETAPMITFTRPGTVLPGVPGHLLPGIKIKFVEGEIVVSGDNVMQGYYNKPEDTALVLKDGWLSTGDLGYLDEKGYLHITGRKKEIIVLPNGKNINPEEVERVVLKNSEFVKEVGVFLKEGILQAIILPDFRKLNEAGITDRQNKPYCFSL
jgi:long-chain acyl-CoA synthetase